MVGSAAAKYAAEMRPNFSICLIGATEPESKLGASIFSSHYDEGRLTRQSAPDPVWGAMAVASIKRYRTLEWDTGISFYQETGGAIIGSPDEEFITSSLDFTSRQQIPVEKFNGSSWQHLFPYMKTPDSQCVVYERLNAGCINPRRMVEAQKRAAKMRGVHIIEDIVDEILAGERDEIRRLVTAKGRRLEARRVLLCTGAFTTCRNLLPERMQPDCSVTIEVVTFGEVSESEAKKLRGMPSVLWDGYNGSNTQIRYKNGNAGCYFLPPISYPDGKYYIKIGHMYQFDKELTCPEEIAEWFKRPAPDNIGKTLQSWLQDIFPGVNFLSFHWEPCVSTITASGRPYIDFVDSNLAVAIGGNGYAAKSSDEFGRLAADLVLNGRRKELSDPFKLRFKQPVVNCKL